MSATFSIGAIKLHIFESGLRYTSFLVNGFWKNQKFWNIGVDIKCNTILAHEGRQGNRLVKSEKVYIYIQFWHMRGSIYIERFFV